VLVIGGGINGAGITRDLVLRDAGLRVALVEKNHFASGTSSRNSQLIHGGLRAFTGAQIAFGADKAAASLAFEHLNRDLQAGGADQSGIVATNVYALSDRMRELIPSLPGVLTFAPVEGVASADGTFAVDSIAAVSR
jgi:L-2-hydroxyglutarate oxidase LhgO